jgi:metal transporter CNNM
VQGLGVKVVASWVALAASLVFFGGLMSGLTLGLLSQDPMNLEVLSKSAGNTKQGRQAGRLLPLIRHHHLVLVTLLLMNSVCSEALPLVLDKLLHPVATIAISVTAVLVFGEIVPQALCARFALGIGARLAWLVWMLIGLSFPISWPIAKGLDWLLGAEHHTLYRRSELSELISLHGADRGHVLSRDEQLIIQGALELPTKTAEACMTPLSEVFMLEAETVLDQAVVARIAERGHSRIPVYSQTRENVVEVLLSKSLIGIDPAANQRLADLPLRHAPKVASDAPLYELLNRFQEGASHLAVVVAGKGLS